MRDLDLNEVIWGERLRKIRRVVAARGVKGRNGAYGLLTAEQKADIQRMLEQGVPAKDIHEATRVSLRSVSRLSKTPAPSATKEFSAWVSIKSRCLNPQHQDYRYYGGRGVSVCNRWRDSYPNFLADVGPAPTAQHTIERLDPNKGYEPHNVIWADRKQQARNRRFCTLSVLKAKAARDLAATGSYTRNQIATILGVTSTAVGQVLRKEIWCD